MKTKILILGLASFTLALVVSGQLTNNVTLTNLNGQIYSGITLDHTIRTGFIWTKPDGTAGLLKFSQLSPETLSSLGISHDQIEAAKQSEARSAEFWKRKAQLDAIIGPIEAKQTQDAASRVLASMEPGRRIPGGDYSTGPNWYGARAPITSGDIRAAQLMSQPRRR